MKFIEIGKFELGNIFYEIEPWIHHLTSSGYSWKFVKFSKIIRCDLGNIFYEIEPSIRPHTSSEYGLEVMKFN